MPNTTGGKERIKTMARVTHLNKSGAGFASKTACGRNVLRTPISTNWAHFLAAPDKCAKCDASIHAAFLRKCDAKKTAA